MKKLGLKPGIAGKRVVMQGLGNVGYYSAIFLQEAGAIITCISEYEGAIFNKDGLDVDAVFNHRKESGSILNYPGAKNLKKNTDALELECDILIPAALEGQIHSGNAANVQAKIIGEAANGPITPEAEAILMQKGAMIIPDLYLNAGGVTVSYFEWLKNLSHIAFGRMARRYEELANFNIVDAIEKSTNTKLSSQQRSIIIKGASERDLVNSGLEEAMVKAYHEIRETKHKHKKIEGYRKAAFVNSINKIAISYMEMGIFP